MVKRYSNSEITVVWQPDLCQHSEHCWRELNAVFDRTRRPWVVMENGTTEEIAAQVLKCPSGALSYVRNESNQRESRESII